MPIETPSSIQIPINKPEPIKKPIARNLSGHDRIEQETEEL